MELCSSRETASYAATQEYPAFYGALKVIAVFINASTGHYPDPHQSSPYPFFISL
jgi:hypothetical protein